MATLIPTRNICLPRMTPGERRFAHRLEDKLEDDYLVWYDVPIGPRQRQPDFVLMHPNRGLLVLEVKDWKIDTLHRLDRSSGVLATERGHVTVANPLAQARAYALELVMALQRDPALCFPGDHSQAGKLRVPWGHGVVLANITRAQFESNGLDNVLPEHLVVCRDEMQEHVDSEAFQERLWAMFKGHLGAPLTLPEIDRIRWHLFPEIRVRSPIQPDLLADDQLGLETATDLPLDLVKVMDLQQEQLARSLGDGHRVIHGVAGSGKTMILAYRCLHLARSLHKPVLVLCYNKTLAARLQHVVAARASDQRVNVRSFHAWCFEMLRAYNLARPPQSPDKARWSSELVDAVIRGVEHGAVPRGQYGAVLIDEGHDFEPHWLRLASRMVDPDSNSLLLLYDDNQSIYGTAARRRFSFASVGIQAQGRTTVLRLNYRNTYEILALAKSFAGDLLADDEADDDVPHAIAPESAGRHGPQPEILDCRSPEHEADIVAARVGDLLAEGHAPERIAVIYRDGAQGSRIGTALRQRGIDHRSALRPEDRKTLFDGPPSVKVVSMHSSKGLEFETVFVSGLGRARKAEDDPVTEARLLYVAMTRAMERLILLRQSGDTAASARLPALARAG